MTVKALPAKFETSDGREFDDEKEASSHEALLGAASEFERARKLFGEAAASSTKTADGELFDFRRWSDYYIVDKYPPILRTLAFGFGTEVTLGGHANDQVRLRIERHPRENSYEVDIGELYRHKKNANAALAKALTEHIAEKQREREELEGIGER